MVNWLGIEDAAHIPTRVWYDKQWNKMRSGTSLCLCLFRLVANKTPPHMYTNKHFTLFVLSQPL